MTHRLRFPSAVAGAVVAGVLAGCSSGDGTDLAEVSIDTTASPLDTSGDTTGQGDETGGVAEVGDGTTEPSVDEPVVSATGDVGASVVVDDTGVPGLDDANVFCRSWSRFGGSFQVVAVNAAFGVGDDLRLAALEIVASPTTTSAYAELSSAWPDELAAEADAALDGVYGPFLRRLAIGREALVEAGATAADLEAIDEAWLQALSTRRPDDPEVVIDLPDDLWALVDEAAPTYLDDVGRWADDDSLASDVEIPLTSAYLADNCPDQGVLAGQEVTETP